MYYMHVLCVVFEGEYMYQYIRTETNLDRVRKMAAGVQDR